MMLFLEIVDCVIIFVEKETDQILQEYISNFFLLSFIPIEQKKWYCIILSYIISLKARNTQMCFFKWILSNVQNENMFKDLILKEFELQNNEKNQLEDLTNLGITCPELAYNILTIKLEQTHNNSPDATEENLENVIYIFENWLSNDSSTWSVFLLNYSFNNEIRPFGERIIISLLKILIISKINLIFGEACCQKVVPFKNMRKIKSTNIISRVHLLILKLLNGFGQNYIVEKKSHNDKKLINHKSLDYLFQSMNTSLVPILVSKKIDKEKLQREINGLLLQISEFLEICLKLNITSLTKSEITCFMRQKAYYYKNINFC
jgi:hypothetical protein